MISRMHDFFFLILAGKKKHMHPYESYRRGLNMDFVTICDNTSIEYFKQIHTKATYTDILQYLTWKGLTCLNICIKNYD